MKSEKAEAYINDNEMDAANLVDKDGCGWAVIGIHYARRAVELAEQEAEERMRKRAIEAYCVDCCCTVVGTCGIGADNCVALRQFIQKLNENEND